MSKVLESLPQGQKVGIAFSGGLDTSVAVAWMRENGAIPCAYTADLGQTDEPDLSGVPGRALDYGAGIARIVDCRAALVEEELVALACGAFHIRSAGLTYFNTTPLGRAVTGTLLVRAMVDDDVDIWGDGSTYKGNDIERFYRYGLLANPRLRIYKPWLDRAFVSELGGRTEMSQWLLARNLPYRASVREGVLHRREHLGRHPRGKTAGAPGRLGRDRPADHGCPVLGPGGHHRRRGRDPLPSNTAGRSRSTVWTTRPVDLVSRPTRSAVGTARISDQIENRIIEAKTRGIYEAPGMALLLIGYERLVNAIHNEDTVASYHAQGRRLGRLLYEGRWLDPQSLMLRNRWSAGAGGGHRRVTVRLPRHNSSSSYHRAAPIVPPGQADAWSGSRTPRSGRSTGSVS